MTKVNLTMTLAVNVNYTQHELDNTSSPAFTDLSYEIIKEVSEFNETHCCLSFCLHTLSSYCKAISQSVTTYN